MSETLIRREYKDRLFKYIFGNEKHKECTLSLYNAINKTSYTRAEEIEMTTIENAVYMSMRNDLSFIIADSMNLYEQQSTYNPNMPLRMLIYTGQLYSKFLQDNELEEKLYNAKTVTVPYPKLIAFYNGDMMQPDRTELKLSDAFIEGAKGDIQVKVTMLNVNYGRNRKLMQKCKPLSDYSLFTSGVREWRRKGLTAEEAVDKALESLSGDSEVKRLILVNKAEVAEMFLYEYNEEGVMNAIREEAREDGIAEGRAEEKHAIARNFLKTGVDLNTISQCTGIPVDELKKLK